MRNILASTFIKTPSREGPLNSILLTPLRGSAAVRFFVEDFDNPNFVEANLLEGQLSDITYYGACDSQECHDIFGDSTIVESLGTDISDYIDSYGIPEDGCIQLSSSAFESIENYINGVGQLSDIESMLDGSPFIPPAMPEVDPENSTLGGETIQIRLNMNGTSLEDYTYQVEDPIDVGTALEGRDYDVSIDNVNSTGETIISLIAPEGIGAGQYQFVMYNSTGYAFIRTDFDYHAEYPILDTVLVDMELSTTTWTTPEIDPETGEDNITYEELSLKDLFETYISNCTISECTYNVQCEPGSEWSEQPVTIYGATLDQIQTRMSGMWDGIPVEPAGPSQAGHIHLYLYGSGSYGIVDVPYRPYPIDQGTDTSFDGYDSAPFELDIYGPNENIMQVLSISDNNGSCIAAGPIAEGVSGGTPALYVDICNSQYARENNPMHTDLNPLAEKTVSSDQYGEHISRESPIENLLDYSVDRDDNWGEAPSEEYSEEGDPEGGIEGQTYTITCEKILPVNTDTNGTTFNIPNPQTFDYQEGVTIESGSYGAHSIIKLHGYGTYTLYSNQRYKEANGMGMMDEEIPEWEVIESGSIVGSYEIDYTAGEDRHDPSGVQMYGEDVKIELNDNNGNIVTFFLPCGFINVDEVPPEPETCPDCAGSGMIPNPDYDPEDPNSEPEITCPTCGGSGTIDGGGGGDPEA